MQLSKDYIVGLVDGEGSFTAFVRNIDQSTERVRRTRIEPRFYIKLIERDKPVLDVLKAYFGCGNVYFQKDIRQNHQNCYRFEVFNRKDLEMIIIPFFRENPPLFTSKRTDFNIFCELMESIKNGEHLSDVGLQRIFELKQKMH
jgi:LAGLIDADG endonuclease